MKNFFLLILLSFSLGLLAQDKPMFNTTPIDNTTKLIGYSSDDVKNGTYERWSFLIDDTAAIRQALSELTVGPEGANMFGRNWFGVSLIQDNKVKMTWMIHPSLKSASYDGHTYKFDLKKLEKLSKKYASKFREEKISFSSKMEFSEHLARQKLDKAFLYSSNPLFRYEGSFEIQFPRTQQFSSPKAISEYLNPLIQKIVRKNEYRISYTADERNLNNRDQFTMKITGSKKIFDNLKLDGLKKMNWSPTDEIGYFYYRSK